MIYLWRWRLWNKLFNQLMWSNPFTQSVKAEALHNRPLIRVELLQNFSKRSAAHYFTNGLCSDTDSFWKWEALRRFFISQTNLLRGMPRFLPWPWGEPPSIPPTITNSVVIADIKIAVFAKLNISTPLHESGTIFLGVRVTVGSSLQTFFFRRAFASLKLLLPRCHTEHKHPHY